MKKTANDLGRLRIRLGGGRRDFQGRLISCNSFKCSEEMVSLNFLECIPQSSLLIVPT